MVKCIREDHRRPRKRKWDLRVDKLSFNNHEAAPEAALGGGSSSNDRHDARTTKSARVDSRGSSRPFTGEIIDSIAGDGTGAKTLNSGPSQLKDAAAVPNGMGSKNSPGHANVSGGSGRGLYMANPAQKTRQGGGSSQRVPTGLPSIENELGNQSGHSHMVGPSLWIPPAKGSQPAQIEDGAAKILSGSNSKSESSNGVDCAESSRVTGNGTKSATLAQNEISLGMPPEPLDTSASLLGGRGRGTHMTKPDGQSQQGGDPLEGGPTRIPGNKSVSAHPSISCPVTRNSRWIPPARVSRPAVLQDTTGKAVSSMKNESGISDIRGVATAAEPAQKIEPTGMRMLNSKALLSSPMPGRTIGKPMYSCPHCGIAFGKKQKRCFEHIKQCVPGDTFRCTICHGVYKVRKWKTHIRSCLDMMGMSKKHIKACHKLKGMNTNQQLAQHSTRSKAFVVGGTDAIVKKILLPRNSHASMCPMAVDPGSLFRLRCTLKGCNLTVDMTPTKAEYLWCRRLTRKTLGLLSISAPLDSKSYRFINTTARSFGIVSNTAIAHMTFAEGLRVSRSTFPSGPLDMFWFEGILAALKDIRMALFVDPSAVITSLYAVPRSSDEQTMLVVADISLPAGSSRAVGRLLTRKECFALPQFPLHVAIGACQKSDTEEILANASSQLVGLTFAVDVDNLLVLPPSLNEKVSRTIAKKQQNSDEFAATVNAATKAANQLNNALRYSEKSMFSWSRDRSGDCSNSLQSKEEIKGDGSKGDFDATPASTSPQQHQHQATFDNEGACSIKSAAHPDVAQKQHGPNVFSLFSFCSEGSNPCSSSVSVNGAKSLTNKSSMPGFDRSYLKRTYGEQKGQQSTSGKGTLTHEQTKRVNQPIPHEHRRTLILGNVPDNLAFYQIRDYFNNRKKAPVQYAKVYKSSREAFVRFKTAEEAQQIWNEGSDGLDRSWVSQGVVLKAVHFTNYMADSRGIDCSGSSTLIANSSDLSNIDANNNKTKRAKKSPTPPKVPAQQLVEMAKNECADISANSLEHISTLHTEPHAEQSDDFNLGGSVRGQISPSIAAKGNSCSSFDAVSVKPGRGRGAHMTKPAWLNLRSNNPNPATLFEKSSTPVGIAPDIEGPVNSTKEKKDETFPWVECQSPHCGPNGDHTSVAGIATNAEPSANLEVSTLNKVISDENSIRTPTKIPEKNASVQPSFGMAGKECAEKLSNNNNFAGCLNKMLMESLDELLLSSNTDSVEPENAILTHKQNKQKESREHLNMSRHQLQGQGDTKLPEECEKRTDSPAENGNCRFREQDDMELLEKAKESGAMIKALCIKVAMIDCELQKRRLNY